MKIIEPTWQDKVTNAAVLEKAGFLSTYLMLCKRRLRWLGHARRMENGRISKDLLHGELATGRRQVGRPELRTFASTIWSLQASTQATGRHLLLIATAGATPSIVVSRVAREWESSGWRRRENRGKRGSRMSRSIHSRNLSATVVAETVTPE